MNAPNLKSFEQILLEKKIINLAQLEQIKDSVDFKKNGLFYSLLNLKTICEGELYQLASLHWSIPFIDIEANNFNIQTDHGIPENILNDLTAVCLASAESRFILALGEPQKLTEVHRIKFFTHKDYNYALANRHQISKVCHQQQTQSESTNSSKQSDLHEYLRQADALDASDIHIESFNGYCRLRTRVDGILHPLKSISHDQGRRLISQIKLLSNMDIAQSRAPQDGRLTVELEQKSLALRINSMPTIHGEKLVLRLLEHHGKRFKLNKIGLQPAQYKNIRHILKQPNGLILVTGPTGSGKTVTLYAILELLNTGMENICTIEDPVEIQEDGINQISINRKSGLDFNTALRALLRQDPDILMIGEIRDQETAHIAVKAAQTGHLVLATLHTRTAAGARTRLLQFGIKAYVLDDCLKLVIAQRLPRLLCVKCRRTSTLSDSQGAYFNQVNMPVAKTIYQQTGCPSCLLGYSGRIGIFELLDSTLATKPQDSMIQTDQHYNLEQAGLRQVIDGNICMDELIRVL